MTFLPPARDSRVRSSSGNALNLLFGAAFLSVLALSLLMRLDGFRDDLWVDELHTAWVVDGSWNELSSRAAIGNQPPLYFAVLKVTTSVVGLHEASLRAMSLVAGFGLVLLAWDFTRRVTGDRWCALLSAFAVGIDSTCVYYSSESRPYALLQLALAVLLCLVVHGGTGLWLSMLRAALAALAVHLQFTSLLFLTCLIAGRLLIACFGSKQDRWRSWRSLGGEMTLISLLCAPLALQVLEVGGRREAWSTFVPNPSWMGLVNLFPWTPALIGFVALAGKLASTKRLFKRAESQAQCTAVGWLIWASVATICLALLLSLTHVAPLFYRRYLLAALWPLLVIPALASWTYRGRARAALLLAILVAVVWNSGVIAPDCWRVGRLTRSRGENWSTATKKIAEIDPHGDLPLYLVSGFIESRQLKNHSTPLLREYCSLPVKTLYRVPHQAGAISPASSVVPYEPPEEWVQRVTEKGGGLWLLRVRDEGAESWRRFGDRLIDRLNGRSREKSWQLFLFTYQGVTILQLKRTSDNPP